MIKHVYNERSDMQILIEVLKTPNLSQENIELVNQMIAVVLKRVLQIENN